MKQHGPQSQRQKAQHESHILPITALSYFGDVVLAGEGNHLCAYHEHNQKCLGSWVVFESQAIHGIVVDPISETILLYGGRFISIGRLSNQDGQVVLSEQTPLEIDDWILDASFQDSHAVLVTAHNALFTAQHQCAEDSKSRLTVLPKVPGSNTILYCAHVQQISEEHWLVAAGTAFGDVVVWSYQPSSVNDLAESAATTTVHYSFSAHEGSTFGVRISDSYPKALLGGPERLLASCSDDRTIRIWDISDLSARAVSEETFDRSTGFGSQEIIPDDTTRPALLAKVMGHVSRIWHVRFDLCADDGLFVKSFGEDATAITWAISKTKKGESTPYSLVQIGLFGANAGKHIWSVASNDQGQFVLGGGDGAISCVPLHGSLPQEQELQLGPVGDTISSQNNDPLKAYAFLDEHTLVTTTLHGRVISYKLSDEEPAIMHSFEQPDLAGYSVVAAAAECAFICGTGDTIYAYEKASSSLFPISCTAGKATALLASSIGGTFSHNDTVLLITKINNPRANLKVLHHQPGIKSVQHLVHDFYYNLIDGFQVIDSTHTRLESDDLLSILGSRHGKVAFYKHSCTSLEDTTINPLLTVALHTEAITSLTWHAPEDDASDGHVLSTSRDGTYAIHAVSTAEADTLTKPRLVHRLALPFGSGLGGLALLHDRQLLAWGFRSTHFIVYSITSQQEIFSVDCGGMHRKWAVWPSSNGLTFVWTKASQVFVKRFRQTMTHLVKTGGHGREVKSMAVKQNVDGSSLVATGAQDTDIRLFAIPPASVTEGSDNLCASLSSCLHILRQHNTGPQHLAFAEDGDYLFTSGGFEEFYVWRLTTSCPIVGIGIVCESVHPQSGKSDLRIMGFQTTRLGTDDWHIAMAYSDSRVALWSYNRAQGWKYLVEADYLTSCPTSIMSDAGQYVSTATDGYIALWRHDNSDERDMLEWTTRHRAHQGAILCSSSYHLSGSSILHITGGDDNAIAVTSRSSGDDTMRTYSIARAHAAAVTAVEAIEAPQHRQSAVFYLVSAALDQRIILWQITADMSSFKARKLQVVHSCVADISSIGLLPSRTQAAIRVIVSGIGMEIWTIPLPTNQGVSRDLQADSRT